MPAFFGLRIYLESAQAHEDTTYFYINTKLQIFTRFFSAFFLIFLNRVSLELSESDARHADLLRKNVKVRVASYLLAIAETSTEKSHLCI